MSLTSKIMSRITDFQNSLLVCYQNSLTQNSPKMLSFNASLSAPKLISSQEISYL